jgi:hypothetical protein
MRTDSHDGELTLPLPRVLQESDAAARAPTETIPVVTLPPREGEPAARSWPRPSKWLVLGLLAAPLAVAGLAQVPAVKTVLRQSFSQLPASSAELFFTSSPSVSGGALDVPITVNVHGAAVRSVAVKVWLVDAAGKTDAATTVDLTPVRGTVAQVVTLQVPTDAEVVFVNLVGQSQTLHYRIAGIRIPASAGGS